MANKKIMMEMLAATLIFGFMAVGCDSGGARGGEADKAVFAGDFSGVTYIDAFKRRFTNQADAPSADAKVVVVSGEYTGAMTEIAAAYQAGAVIVLVQPTGAQQAHITSQLTHRPALTYDTGREPMYDMYAFNRFDDHHILSMTWQPTEREVTETITTDENGERTTTTSTSSVAPGDAVTAANPAPFIDAMAAWIDEHNNGSKGAPRNARSAADDVQNVQNIMNAQKIVLTYNAACPDKLENTNITSGSIAVSSTYNIWALYDITNQQDYYIVREDISIPSGNLWYEENHGAGDYQDTGFYLTGFESNNIPQQDGLPLALNSEVFLMSSSPSTTNGTATVGTSTSWSQTGSFGFNGASGTGSLGGSTSYTSSFSNSIADFGVSNNSIQGTYNSANTKWTYTMGDENTVGPQFTFTSVTEPTRHSVGGAPALARTTARWCNEWVWRIPTAHDSDTVYQMQAGRNITFGYSYIELISAWNTDGGHHVRPSAGYIYNVVNLTPPPRGGF